MTKLNPFRVSFDRPLEERERKRARIAATVVSATALVLGVASVSSLLNASSGTVAAWTNAAPKPEVRILAREGEDPAGKSCEEQTWPYIEQRCLKPAVPKTQARAERTTPKHGLAAQFVTLPSAPAPIVEQAPAVLRETTGSASPSDDSPPQATASPHQAVMAAQPAGPALGAGAATQRLDARPRLSPREARILQREERKQLQRQRREEAKRTREERVKVRAEAREAKRQSGRVIVIRRGSLDDDFFRPVR